MVTYQHLIAGLLPNVGNVVCALFFRKGSGCPMGAKSASDSKCMPPSCCIDLMHVCLQTGIGAASYLAWRDGGGFEGEARLPLALYGAHLVLQGATPTVYYRMNNCCAAAALGIATWVTAGGCALMFYRINEKAGLLMLPYWAGMTICWAILLKQMKKGCSEGKKE